jgi:hypothetical protein
MVILAIRSITFAELDGGRRVPVWDGFDIHGETSAGSVQRMGGDETGGTVYPPETKSLAEAAGLSGCAGVKLQRQEALCHDPSLTVNAWSVRCRNLKALI